MSEAYERGLEKLGLVPDRICWVPCGEHRVEERCYYPDLRIDAAFAWRVLEALLSRPDAPDISCGQCAEGYFCVSGDAGEAPEADGTGATLADALYAVVEALGQRG